MRASNAYVGCRVDHMQVIDIRTSFVETCVGSRASFGLCEKLVDHIVCTVSCFNTEEKMKGIVN